MSRKIYVIGGGSDCDYACWMDCTGFTESIEDADFCLALGGADISPKYYNQKNGGHLSCHLPTDEVEYADFQKAIKLGKKIVGICKGSQWGSVLAGGALFQHVIHPFNHEIITYDGLSLLTNSTHHNMADLSKLKKDTDYKLLAWANGISPFRLNGEGESVKCPLEPEVVFYPKIKFLAFQNHNESLWENPKFRHMIAWSRGVLDNFLADMF